MPVTGQDLENARSDIVNSVNTLLMFFFVVVRRTFCIRNEKYTYLVYLLNFALVKQKRGLNLERRVRLLKMLVGQYKLFLSATYPASHHDSIYKY